MEDKTTPRAGAAAAAAEHVKQAIEAAGAVEAYSVDGSPEALLAGAIRHLASAVIARPNAGGHAPDLVGIPAMIAELRRLCAEPFDTLEIEGDDGAITDTRVVRAADIIAAINDHIHES